MKAPSSGTRREGLGLVLSSGAACGAAHVGVLQALEDADVPVPVVAGASAGALVGAGWAAGISAGEIAEWVLRATWMRCSRAAASRTSHADSEPSPLTSSPAPPY